MPPLDQENNCIPVVKSEHFMIHEGKHFFVSDYDGDVDTGTPKLWRFKRVAGGLDFHLSIDLASTKNGVLEVFEAPTVTNAGTPLTIFNNKRSETRVSDGEVAFDPIVSADGTRLIVQAVGDDTVGNGAKAGFARTNEIELKSDTEYLVKFTTLTDNARISILAEFYHPNMD